MALVRKAPCLLILLPSLLFADEVYLKGGGSFSGRIVGQTETMVSMDIGDGVVGIAATRIDRIVKGPSPLDDFDKRASKLAPGDVNGWRNLGRWAAEQGLSTQSRQAYEKVIVVAPNDAEARQALGFVLTDGTWMTGEQSYLARGYVKYDGEWMTPAAAQVAQASDAADHERRKAEERAQDAEAAAAQAEQRAHEAEKKAEEAESYQQVYDPLYMGGFGYGVSYWPSSPVVRSRPVVSPAPITGRGRR